MPFAAPDSNTFFITSVTYGRRNLLQSERMAALFMDCLAKNCQQHRFLLHEFVVMPDHVHLLITPASRVTLQKAVQFIKGGFSYHASKELHFHFEIWQPGYTNHAIRDRRDYEQHRSYILLNPVEAGLCESPEQFPYSSAYPGMDRRIQEWTATPRQTG